MKINAETIINLSSDHIVIRNFFVLYTKKIPQVGYLNKLQNSNKMKKNDGEKCIGNVTSDV